MLMHERLKVKIKHIICGEILVGNQPNPGPDLVGLFSSNRFSLSW